MSIVQTQGDLLHIYYIPASSIDKYIESDNSKIYFSQDFKTKPDIKRRIKKLKELIKLIKGISESMSTSDMFETPSTMPFQLQNFGHIEGIKEHEIFINNDIFVKSYLVAITRTVDDVVLLWMVCVLESR